MMSPELREAQERYLEALSLQLQAAEALTSFMREQYESARKALEGEGDE